MLHRCLFAVAALLALGSRAEPVITEVAWMGSDGSASDEWLEIHNPDAQPVDLADFVIIQGATVRPLSALPVTTLADGAFLVLERQAPATPLEEPFAVAFSFGGGLTNGGQALCLCAAAATTCADASCDVANPDGGAWFAGDNDVP